MAKYTPSDAHVDPPLPAGSWDTHFHIFPPGFPLSSTPLFVPPRIPLSEARRFHEELGTPNRVMAHSFAFGHDQASLENWLESAGGGTRRALAVVTAETSDDEIRRMHTEGVRGVRAVNPSTDAMGKAEDVKKLMEKLDKAGVKWTVAVQEAPTPAVWDALLSIVDKLPPSQILMIDHLGFLPGPWGQSPPLTPDAEACQKLPHVDAVLHLLARENVYIKISAPYRITTEYEALEGLVKAVVAAAPSQIVWASDWPFVPLPAEMAAHNEKYGKEEELEFRKEDMPRWIALLRKWMDEKTFEKMMVENPARIYAE